jgi:proprotein convertase subtilisin/kexin type 5
MCYNSAYLHGGVCIDTCPDGFASIGEGKFKRHCLEGDAPACIKKQDDCHECNEDASACNFCRNNAYLHDGACHASCPDGLAGVGNGFYKRRCEDSDGEESACTRKEGNCHQCNDDGTECATCYNQKYLHKGVCVATCPDGFFPVGFGNFRRTCEQQ